MLIDDDLKEQALFRKKKKNKKFVKDPAAKPNMAINESEDLISEEGDTRSMIEDDMDVEVERRMSQLIVDIDGVGEEK